MAADSVKRAKSKAELETKMHYPWLLKFDQDVKDSIREDDLMEISISHVLKLLTFLECQMSSEVSKLKNKPNRATKFLGFIKKRINMVKLSGQLVDPELEHELFPTYGLLMTHYVNITLVSSKMDKLAAKEIALELYFILNLMFHGDPEYVLDVILCSNLAEHAGDKDEIGFKLFEFVVEDWRTYSENNSSMVRYCAIASLLRESKHGQSIIMRSLPRTPIPPTFFQHLPNVCNIPPDIKNISFANIVENLKPRKVIASSRRRLIVVSESHFSKKKTPEEVASDLQSNSTVRNVVASSTCSENPNPTGSNPQQIQDGLNDILGDIGVHFFLDSSGRQPNQVDFESFPWSTSPDGRVSSSTVNQTLLLTHQPLVDSYLPLNIDQEVDPGSDTDVDDKQAKASNRTSAFSLENKLPQKMPPQANVSPMKRGSNNKQESDSEPDVKTKKFAYSEQDSDMDVDENEQDEYDRANEYFSEVENEDEIQDNDTDSDDYQVKRKRLTSSKVRFNEEEDSDLEIVSENVSTHGNSFSKLDDDDELASNGSSSRDEAEPESGEDFVPNYEIDSDEESSAPVVNESDQVMSTADADSTEEISQTGEEVECEVDEGIEMSNGAAVVHEDPSEYISNGSSPDEINSPNGHSESPIKTSSPSKTVPSNSLVKVTVNIAGKLSSIPVGNGSSVKSPVVITPTKSPLKNGTDIESATPFAVKKVVLDSDKADVEVSSQSQSIPARKGKAKREITPGTPVRRSSRFKSPIKATEFGNLEKVEESESDNESLASNSTKKTPKKATQGTRKCGRQSSVKGSGRFTRSTKR